MSDLLAVDRKVREGDSWRGYETVEIDGSELEVCYRLLYEKEESEILEIVGREKFVGFVNNLESALGEADRASVERYQELATVASDDVDQLSDEEQKEFVELSEELDGAETSVIEVVDPDIVEGMHEVVRKCVVPDDDDVDAVMDMSIPEQNELFGEDDDGEAIRARTRDEARELLKEHVVDRIVSKSRGYTAHSLGFTIFLDSREAGN